MTDRHRQVKYEQLPDTQTDTETATATETERERATRNRDRDTNRNRNQAGTKRTDPACRQVQCAKRDAAENQKQKKVKKIIVCATMKDAACSQGEGGARAPGMS